MKTSQCDNKEKKVTEENEYKKSNLCNLFLSANILQPQTRQFAYSIIFAIFANLKF